MAKGDFDFLKERNTCSACCLCSVLTMDGGACKKINILNHYLRTTIIQLFKINAIVFINFRIVSQVFTQLSLKSRVKCNLYI